MIPIFDLQKLGIHDIPQAGGKGAILGEMLKAGFPVPPGFVVPASVFMEFLKLTEIQAEIDKRTKNLNIKDVNAVNRMSRVVMDLITDVQFPESWEKDLLRKFDSFANYTVAVRSSATAEDSQVASWAGELETFLNIGRDDFLKKIRACWASLHTPRAIFYRFEQGLDEINVSVAVVVQAMVASEKAGVVFTVHPISKDKQKLVIEAGWGLGETVVSGIITPDTYVVDKQTLEIVEVNIGSKKQQAIYGDSGTKLVDVSLSESRKQVLKQSEIRQLAKICLALERYFKFPCDIEWAYADGQIHITQSRRVTTLKP